jgi:hypothetical protein
MFFEIETPEEIAISMAGALINVSSGREGKN